jgi:Protein of unknown function (DUF4058)
MGRIAPDCQVYSWMLPDRLPTLPNPLRVPDADLRIDLAAVLNTAYNRGRFRRRIDYKGTDPAHLSENELAWAKTLL